MELNVQAAVQGVVLLVLGATLTKGCAIYEMVLQHEARIGYIEPLVVHNPDPEHRHE